jgi:CDP-diacylglycerol---serine O-phosphatidyltransferase
VSVAGDRPRPRHFALLRSFALPDFITLSNAACGTASIFFCLNYLEAGYHDPFIKGAFLLLPLALVFDVADGLVARGRQRSSPFGADLDSLADVVSFGVAPAVLGFTLGLRGLWDAIVLCGFVCCGVSRLARFNVTAATLAAEGGGKVKYYEGTPIPSSLLIVLVLAVMWGRDAVGDHMWLGKTKIGPGYFHPFVLVYAASGCAMMSARLRIPKP